VRGCWRRLNRGGRGRLGVRARGGGGAVERVELGLKLGSDSGAGEEKTPTGGALLQAPEGEKGREREGGAGRERADGPGKWAVRTRGEEGREGRKRGHVREELGWTGEWAARAGKENGGEGKGRGPGCRGEKEKKGRKREGKRAGWAGPKGEKREGEKKKEGEQMLLNLNMKIEFKFKSK
jgi:hypothetical protein